MATQLGSLAFIAEGSTKRKEILAKFLDLEIFDDKFKLAKDDASDLRGAIKRLEAIDFEQQIEEVTAQLESHNVEIDRQKNLCAELKDKTEKHRQRSLELQEQIGAIPATIIDHEAVEKKIITTQDKITKLKKENSRYSETKKANVDLVQKISTVLADSNIDEYENKQKLINNMNENLSEVISEISKVETYLQVEERKIQLLDQVPCGEQYPQCRFIKDAFAALETVGLTKTKLSEMKRRREDSSNELEVLDPDRVSSFIEKHNRVVEKQKDAQGVINKMELSIAKNKNQILRLENDLTDNKNLLSEYEENREVIENLEELTTENKTIQTEIAQFEKQTDDCENTLMSLYRDNGSLGQRKEDLEAQRVELQETRDNYCAYDLFMSCMHTNGISLDIIKNKLPVLNDEISSVLANIVDFEVFLENEDKKLEIFIKHPKYDARPLEMGSGAEKTIAAMAIRLALLNVSSLPKGDLFILDEPGTALDEENMEGFIRILDLVKSNFKTVLLISHLDSLKDAVDSQISIEKKRNFASVKH